MINQKFYILGRLKDPFPPARIAAINALAATQQFYTLAETSGRVVPILCPLMSDPEKPVREQAFKVSFKPIYILNWVGWVDYWVGWEIAHPVRN